MSIEDKYFNHDKNYLLKTVQAFSKESLLLDWTSIAYDGYMSMENPLGLEDDFTINLKTEIHKGAYILEEVYDLLAAVYRFRYGDNQLAFVWDGRSHLDYYDEKWKGAFADWIDILSHKNEVYRGVIKAALADDKTNTDFLANFVKRIVLSYFDVKLTRSHKLRVQSA